MELCRQEAKERPRHEINAKGDQYVLSAWPERRKAIISWGIGKSGMPKAPMDFLHTSAAASLAAEKLKRRPPPYRDRSATPSARRVRMA